MASGAERVATLLLTLERPVAAGLLKRLPEKDRQSVTQALAAMSDVFLGRDLQETLLTEFHKSLGQSTGSAADPEQICQLLNDALGEEAESIADRLGSQDRGDVARAQLARLDAASLAFLLNDEHPQAVALVLLELPSDTASVILQKLPEDRQQSLVERMVAMPSPPEEVVIEIIEAAVEKSRTLESAGSAAAGKDTLKMVAGILNRFTEEQQQNLLVNLEANDPERADKVKQQLFTFDDLLKLGPREIQRVLSGIDTKVLATALKGASPEATVYLMGNLSKRTQERVREERETMGALRLSEVRQAQKEMASVARDLIQRGEIKFASGGADELVN